MVDKLAVTGGYEVLENMWVYIRDVIDEKCSHNNIIDEFPGKGVLVFPW